MAKHDTVWHKLIEDPNTLWRGWHLARADARQDFLEDYPHLDAIGYSVESVLAEIRRTLKMNSFDPRPLLSVEVPKGSLGIRPGTVIPIQDRILLFAILREIAPTLDQLLPEGVYSYRVKDKPSKTALFHESDVLQIPFLKSGTIKKYADPFEPWYALWPKFDKVSLEAADEYEFLSICDISAYFENINLEILRQLITNHLGDEQKIINIVMACYESWAVRSPHGFRPMRGIPQGNGISSFFGNLYLLALDEAFSDFAEVHEIAYFRYMDDVRIFSKEASVARLVVFEMDRVVRRLHLNIQSAKTKILKGAEIKRQLHDGRIDALQSVREHIIEARKEKDEDKKAWTSNMLQKIASQKVDNGQKLLGNKKPLGGLSLRAYRVWINCKAQLGENSYMDGLFRELVENPDHRLTRAFQSAIRRFPRKKKFVNRVLNFLKSDLNIYPHQEAELIRALRYASEYTPEFEEYVIDQITSAENFYVRTEASYLAARLNLDFKTRKKLLGRFSEEPSELALTALALPLGQFKNQKNRDVVLELVHHPNARVSSLGRHIRKAKNELAYSKEILDFVFDKKNPMRICDEIGILWYISQSIRSEIRLELLSRLAPVADTHYRIQLRTPLKLMKKSIEDQELELSKAESDMVETS